ncbi:hypothetical protein JNX00_17105 [Hydrogenophaga sp. YM1]|uniref:hypothetical protein n=1 Tax=Hydrogenophaga sp. YM1 TaxID=2806262 RepID=UPI00195F19AA|nr:hypothetical protein [Hydrogenophaga sp. YM1]QRR33347.1 hypothetical protein JNX00_17105 [Hydrogenophaga sp. YM1]
MRKSIQFAVMVIVCAISAEQAMAGEDRTFEDARLKLCKELREMLVQKNQCSGEQDCAARQLLFCSPAKSGLSFQLWGVQDKAAHAEAIAIIGREFAQQGGQMNAKLVAYSNDKKTSLATSFWEKNKVILEVDFQGGK